MTILYVITELHEGGAENALFEVASRVAAEGHSVHVVCLYGGQGAVGERLRGQGIPVHQTGRTLAGGLLRLLRLRSVVTAVQPDLVHAWLFHANFACRLAVPGHVPLLCSLRVCEPRKSHILLDRWTRRRVNMYIANSEDVARFAQKQLRIAAEKCRVILNGVNVSVFQRDQTRSAIYEKICGLTVGRVDPQKGQDILIRALAGLPPDIPWEWHFAGSVTSEKFGRRLQEIANRSGIGEKLHWHGQVPRSELPELYKQANLLALPSRWEGQPNVLLEAMAAGVPVLSSMTDGVQELLQEDEDCLRTVSPNTSEAWTRAMVEVWEHPEERAKQIEAGARLAANRSWDVTVAEHLEVYRASLEGRCRKSVKV